LTMGSALSSNIPSESNADNVDVNRRRNSSVRKNLANATFAQLQQDIQRSNDIVNKSLGSSLEFVLFPKQFSDFPFPSLWKFQVLIEVQRKGSSHVVRLNFKQFYILFNEIQLWKTLHKSNESNALDELLANLSDESNVCLICMEGRTDIVLNCTHSFCSKCIGGWRQRSNVCPMCRKPMEKNSDDWVLVENNMNEEDLLKYLTARLEDFVHK